MSRARRRAADAAGDSAGDSSGDTGWLDTAVVAAERAAGTPADLLGELPGRLLDAVRTGRRPDRAALRTVTDLGRQAAEQGVPADAVVSLYLSFAVRLWRDLPAAARPRHAAEMHSAAEALLAVITDASAALIAGHQTARQQMIRREQTSRQEFLDDLLRGDADVARMVERAEPFGLDLGATHHVVLAAPPPGRTDVDRAALAVERSIVDAFGDRDVLVGIKDGRVVAIVPGTGPARAGTDEATIQVAQTVQSRIGQATRSRRSWTVAAGRAFPGTYGVARSYEEARETLHLAERLGLDPVHLSSGQLLVHRVISRDQAAIVDLVRSVLTPLELARGGATPLLETLRAYFACSHVATETARALHVSVRTVTYRLDRVRQLTGYEPGRPRDDFVLQTAAHGAQLLQWPARPLPAAT